MTTTPVLSVQGVHKRFKDLHAVADVSYDVHRGEILGFLGPNGAGKTTTLRMLMGITRPDEGQVLFEGKTTLDRSRVGYPPEERGLFEDAACIDTLVYLGQLRRMSAADARREAKVWLERLELGDRMGAKLNTLSKGNQQKVQFAGAVLHRPSLAVLDEPFSGLDPLNQELFIDLIRGLRDEGTAVLLSAHQLDLVERLCDRFYLISRGKGILEGTLEALREKIARGAGEVLTVGLREIDAKALDRDVPAALAASGFEAEWQKTVTGERTAAVEISLPAGADLSPLLAELGERFRIERVEMRPLRLHEIYVRAVREDGDAAPAPSTPKGAAHA
jgi:ABC-2 type transport system ATP-binding protein